MNDRTVGEFRRAGETPAHVRALWFDRWYGRAAMLAASIVLLTFAYAPYHQLYLAWVGLVPWLLMVRRTRSIGSAFWWSWLGGTAFFIANMWWLAYVTVPGMFALLIYLGLSWGVAGMIVRGAGLLQSKDEQRPASSSAVLARWSVLEVVAFAAIWSGLEWFRGNYPFDGLPWLYLGHSQTPALAMCQIADVLGTTGVTFWVAMFNALVAALVLSRGRLRPHVPAAALVAVVLVAVGAYGWYRIDQADATSLPGPRVLVVQANFPQSNETGRKGATLEEIVQFHVETTQGALEKLRNGPNEPPVDLVVWSETMMPDINARARELWRGQTGEKQKAHAAFLDQTFDRLQSLTRQNNVALLTGGGYFDARWDRQKGTEVVDNRNSAYLFDRSGRLQGRYDKIHLVPWGEFIPFKHTIPWLYNMFLQLSPYDYDYTLTPGNLDNLTIFELSGAKNGGAWSFVVPICFEDIDAGLVAKMFRHAPAGGNKRATFIVNITNDGWFKANEQPQHLQVAIFRSIENRVPTARSVNTGISGFIDSVGRVSHTVPKGTAGWRVATVTLDARTTLFTRFGEWFAILCAIATALIAAGAAFTGWRRRTRRLAEST